MYVVHVCCKYFSWILWINLAQKSRDIQHPEQKIKYNKSECLTFFFEDNNEKRNIHMNKCMFMYKTFLQDQIFSTANLTVIY